MNEKFRWINIFVRDILLILIMLYVNWYVSYESWWAAFILGMLLILITWHLSDLILKYRRAKLWNGMES